MRGVFGSRKTLARSFHEDKRREERIDFGAPRTRFWRPQRDLNPCYRRERTKGQATHRISSRITG